MSRLLQSDDCPMADGRANQPNPHAPWAGLGWAGLGRSVWPVGRSVGLSVGPVSRIRMGFPFK